MRKHYRSAELRAGARGKYRAAFLRRTKLIPPQPNVAAAFPASPTVNYALNRFISSAQPAKVSRVVIKASPATTTVQSRGRARAKRDYANSPAGRQRDRNVAIRHKRSDTLVGTLRKEHGKNFATGYRSDTKLGTVLRKEGVETLRQLLRRRS
jgi:hypothetical protein